MANENNEETAPEKKYISFHREREQPVDCFTRHEIDKKLKSMQAAFNKNIQQQKDETESFHKEEIKNLKSEFNGILKKIGDKFQRYYTQEKVDQFFNVLQSGNTHVKWSLEEIEKRYGKLEGMVIEYMELNDHGKIVGDTFVFNEKQKKRFWKK